MSLILEFSPDFNCSSKSKSLNIYFLTLVCFIPSITDVCIEASEIIESDSFNIASKNLEFASKQFE